MISHTPTHYLFGATRAVVIPHPHPNDPPVVHFLAGRYTPGAACEPANGMGVGDTTSLRRDGVTCPSCRLALHQGRI